MSLSRPCYCQARKEGKETDGRLADVTGLSKIKLVKKGWYWSLWCKEGKILVRAFQLALQSWCLELGNFKTCPWTNSSLEIPCGLGSAELVTSSVLPAKKASTDCS